MKKTILFLVLCIIIPYISTAQSWTKISGGDYYNGTSVYFTDVNTGYLTTEKGTIFKTTDAGSNWNSILTGVTSALTDIHFTNSNTGYACGDGGIILKTIDAGTTWTKLNSGKSSILASIYFTDNNTGYISGNNGVILKTTDAGNSWVTLTSGSTQNYLKSIYFTDSNTGFIVGDGGIILKTLNAGISWLQINSGTTLPLNSIYFTSSNIGYIAGAGVMLKTVDSGNSWSLTTSNYYINSIYFTDANTGYVSGNYIFNTETYTCLGKTTDAGATWVYTKSEPKKVLGFQSIFFIDKDNGYSVGPSNVVNKTSNAGNDWNSQSFGDPEQTNSVFFTDESTGYNVSSPFYGSGECLIRKTVDGGKKWSIINRLVETNLNAVLFTNSNTGYVLSDSKIYKTVNAGSTWTAANAPIGRFYALYFTDINTGYVTEGGGRIYKTIDGGDNWSSIFTAPSALNGTNLLSIFFIDNKIGFAAGYSGTNDIVYKTIDGGNNWTQITLSTSKQLRSIFFTSARTGFCVGSGGTIYRSSDLGNTWSIVNSGITNVNFNSICFADDKIGFIAGSNGRMLQSSDAGITWTSLNPLSNDALITLNFPRVYTRYASGAKSTVLKNDTCNSFTADLSQTNVNCYEVNNGSASVTVRGGTPPFTYLWSNGETTPTISGLSPGLYSVTVKMTGQVCPITKSVTITGPSAPLTASFVATPNTKCSGVCDGALTINATGGTSPYTYQWNAIANNQTTKTITGLCSDRYTVVITDANGCKLIKEVVLQSTSNFNAQVYLTNIAAVDQINVSPAFTTYYAYSLPSKITPNPANPRNFVDPGKKARFKVECTNKKTNGLSIVSGVCKVTSNCPYIIITDSNSALNNIGWNNKAWSADEFEIEITPNTPPGTIAYIDFIVQENGVDYPTTCIPIPITPLVYSATTSATIDDDSNPDSNGNDNDMCEPNEIIEFYPWLDNISTLNAEYVRGRFENLDNLGYINIWNNKVGVGTTVYDTSWWNFAFAQPTIINSNTINTTPEYDFVFDYNNPSTVNNFKLYMVMAGGFKLFPGSALSLVQWSLPYTFNNVALSTPDFFQSNNIIIYPNPTTTFINVKVNPYLIGSRFTITDVVGKIVLKGEILSETSNIDIEKFSKGTYFFKAGNNLNVLKIVKE